MLETPGHTPEHVAYAVADRSRADEPVLLFTGGSLLVGAVGRTDLLGEENALPYARAMFQSLNEVILPHEDFVGVYPTHGAGSLCSTGISSTPSSTIGFERRHNPMIGAADVDAFARVLLSGQPAFPRYFARMRPTNQAGPRLLGGVLPEPRPLDLDEVRAELSDGALVVDLRSPSAYAASHIPGSLSIPAGSSFGTWLGWVVEHDRPVVLVLERPDDWDDAIRQALRIGHERIVGHLRGGFGSWAESGAPIEVGGRLTVDQLAARLDRGGPEAPLVIDVRQLSEYEAGHVPGSLHLAAGSLPDRLDELPRDRPIAAVCASGYRSSVAASLLQAAGFTDVSWVADGVPTWRRRGFPTDRGAPDVTAETAASGAAALGRRPRAPGRLALSSGRRGGHRSRRLTPARSPPDPPQPHPKVPARSGPVGLPPAPESGTSGASRRRRSLVYPWLARSRNPQSTLANDPPAPPAATRCGRRLSMEEASASTGSPHPARSRGHARHRHNARTHLARFARPGPGTVSRPSRRRQRAPPRRVRDREPERPRRGRQAAPGERGRRAHDATRARR